ncbi:MAG: hypothetical protein HOQ43_10745 [Glycomyces artemisiae]|uniref:Uncharacterized protein n=1 Tax=Glycomyces artemisiae TaxID=1076443 RepID=A0A850C9L6_9ACTN|nr:hypothetical protein [Glycomyces artemisiae]
MLTFLLIGIGALLACVAFVVLVSVAVAWLVGNLVERRATRRSVRHASEAVALTRPLPRRKAPTAERLRGDRELAAVEAELDATYRALSDLYL